MKALASLIATVAMTATIEAQTPAPVVSVRDAVSSAEIQKTLQAFDLDRTSGKDGERRAAEYLAKKLTEYGIRHAVHETRLYMSWPVSAEIAVPGSAPFSIQAAAPAFGASTPAGGLTADVMFLSANQLPDADVRGKIVVAFGGGVSPDRTLAVQRAGAVGLVQVDQGEIVHEMIATTIWGTPTTVSAARIPTIPVVGIRSSDGERLKAANPSTLRLSAQVEQGWATAPLVVAEVPGHSRDFVLVATHIDAWYRGMTDTAGTNASILEMARVLQQRQSTLERGVRFAWWPGHSFGRYAGSTWYVDRFWSDLDQHCIAYTNLDGSGRRGSRMDAVSAGGWPGIAEFSREFARTLTGKTPEQSQRAGLFRPGRDSDSAFQGLGIPEFFIGVPGPPRGHPDVEAGGRIRYWHTAEDTIDKIDPRALLLDTQYRIAQLFELATTKHLPLKIAPIATAFTQALEELATVARAHLDLTPAQRAAAALVESAARLDAFPRPSDTRDGARMNGLLVRVTHRLNSALYTAAGRFDQDPAASVPILPLLARAPELPQLSPDSDVYGFLQTELLRGRNAVEAVLRESGQEIEVFLAARSGVTRRTAAQ
jgi:N-acetylated-alpha-linked acidic dipeptidase